MQTGLKDEQRQGTDGEVEHHSFVKVKKQQKVNQ